MLGFTAMLPSLAALARQRTEPPPVPPLLARSEFSTDEEHKTYMATRRKAQERWREFNRPARTGRVRRAGVAQPTAASQALSNAVEELRKRERRVLFGMSVETGRKKAPSMNGAVAAKRKPMAPAARHALHQQRSQRLPKLTSAAKLRSALRS